MKPFRNPLLEFSTLKLSKIKKRKREEGKCPSKKTKSEKANSEKKVELKIQPGESMRHFNRLVEDDWRPLFKVAVQTSRAVGRSVAKEGHEARIAAKKAKQAKNKPKEAEETEREPEGASLPASVDKFKDCQKEFQSASSSAPKRLNDIAQAPPEFKKLPRGASAASAIGKRDGVLSKVTMEQEREKAITRYRELKASQRKNGEVGDKLANDNE